MFKVTTLIHGRAAETVWLVNRHGIALLGLMILLGSYTLVGRKREAIYSS